MLHPKISTMCATCTDSRCLSIVHHYKHYSTISKARMWCTIFDKRLEAFRYHICSLCRLQHALFSPSPAKGVLVCLMQPTNKSLRSPIIAYGWYILNKCHIILCYCFVRKETTLDYCWAMNKMKDLFYDWGITHQLAFVTDR